MERARKAQRSDQIMIRIEPELHNAIKIAAEQDHRPVGNLVRKILADWLDSRPQAA
jgi:predicted HicB family RNase H-like nuclease